MSASVAPAVPAGPGLSRAVWRLRLAAVCLGLTLLALSQNAGAVVADTKLDLVVAPGRLLGRGLHLWDPLGAFGQLQNQAYGYLFPMGPFFLVGDGLAVPDWVVQRLWYAALLVAAFLGMVRLAGRLRLGPPWALVVAGLAYALAPRVLSELGSISSELMPVAAAPWVLLPLVDAVHPRRAAARSGVALLFAGGVNAAATLAILPLPVWWLLTREPGPARRRLAAWWAAAVVAACAWWALPLLVLGSYSPPFLDWIESASTTTSVGTLFEALRGTSHWLPLLVGPAGPEWPAGHLLATTRVGVLATGGVALLALLGLTRPALPHRRFLAGAVLIGVALLTLGHVGPLAGAGAGPVRDLLDGPLAPFRNVHKFDPVLRLPLALGLAWFLATVRGPRAIPYGRVLVPALAVALLAVTTGPALAGRLTPGRTVDVAAYWAETARWLAGQPGDGRALLVPGATTGAYVWGRTGDDALQPLAETPWAVRDSVPLGSAGATRLLDAVGARLDAGRGGPGLARVLVRAGVGHVVVRNDLDQLRARSSSPDLVHEALRASPGLTRVAAFGPLLPQLSGTSYPAVEVYATGGTAAVTRLPAAGALRTIGGPEDVLALADRGLLGDRALLLPGDDAGPADAAETPVLSDSHRRREVRFSSVREVAGPALTATEPYRADRPVHDYVPTGAGPPAVQEFRGPLVGVSASSAGSDADALLARGNWHQPWAAVDGDPDTGWVSGSFTGAVGQWLELRFAQSVPPGRVELAFTAEEFVGPLPTRVTVTTDVGSVSSDVSPDPAPQFVRVPEGPTTRLRITVEAVRGGGKGFATGIAALSVPLLFPQRTLTLPPATGGGTPVVLLGVAPGGHPGCVRTPDGVACTPSAARPGEEDAALDRTFGTGWTDDLTLGVTVRSRPGRELDLLLTPGPTQLRAGGSSSLGDDPRVRPNAAVDGDPGTGWVSDPGDEDPVLRLAWSGRRLLQGVQLTPLVSTASVLPAEVEVTAGGRRTRVPVGTDGTVLVPPVPAERLTLRAVPAAGGEARSGPVGIAEVRLLTATDIVGADVAPGDVLALPCGAGPVLELDGREVPLTVRAPRSAWAAGVPMTAVPCAAAGPVTPGGGAGADVRRNGSVRLAAGQHRLRIAATGTLFPDTVTLVPARGLPPRPALDATATALDWGDTARTVRVAAAPAATYLVVHENANAGWRARLGDRELTAARVDGWQQAWVVPAGVAGDVRLTYAPDRPYRLGLGLGALLAAGLVALAFGRAAGGGGSAPRRAWAERRTGRLPWLLLLAAALLTAPVLLLPLAVGVVVVGLIPVRPAHVGTALVGLGLGTAVLVAGLTPPGGEPFGRTAVGQLCCAVALAGVLLPLLPRLRPPRPRFSAGRSTST